MPRNVQVSIIVPVPLSTMQRGFYEKVLTKNYALLGVHHSLVSGSILVFNRNEYTRVGKNI